MRAIRKKNVQNIQNAILVQIMIPNLRSSSTFPTSQKIHKKFGI